jgi:hypothetical protein
MLIAERKGNDMSALIALHLARTPISAIQVACNPHLGGVGRTLLEHYSDTARVHALLALGDLSILGAQLGDTAQKPLSPAPDTCVALHRDWGDTLEVRSYPNRPALLDRAFGYIYLWDGEMWRANVRVHSHWLAWKPLAQLLFIVNQADGLVAR